jgi:hypothetical protein
VTDLTPEDETLLALARGGFEPTARDRARVGRKVLAQIGAGAAATLASASSAASSAAAGGASMLFVKIAVGAAMMAAVVDGGMIAFGPPSHASRTAHRAPLSVASPAASPASPSEARGTPVPSAPARETPSASPMGTAAPTSGATLKPPGRALPPMVDLQRAPASTSPGATDEAVARLPGLETAATAPLVAGVSASAVASPPPLPDVSAEAERLRAVDEARRVGDGLRALSLLEKYGVDFPRGALAEEYEAERVEVLCGLGRVAEARAAGSRFVRDRPRSPLSAGIRAACGVP